jgi:hypothetical protein
MNELDCLADRLYELAGKLCHDAKDSDSQLFRQTLDIYYQLRGNGNGHPLESDRVVSVAKSMICRKGIKANLVCSTF